MRIAAVCPECAVYQNAKCILYNGEYLPCLDIAPGDNLEDILVKLNTLMSGNCWSTTTTTTTTTVEVTTTTTTTEEPVQ